MMNGVFEPEQAAGIVEEVVSQISPGLIEENVNRWGHLSSSDDWYGHIDDITLFLLDRPAYVRRQLMDYFDLSGTANLMIESRPGRGHILINGRELVFDNPGVDGVETWSGTYFQGVPVEITAVPLDGYHFAGWKDTEWEETSLMMDLTEDITLVAEFEANE